MVGFDNGVGTRSLNSQRNFFMKQKIVFLFVGTLLLSGCAGLVNPVPVAGTHQTAQQKSAQKHQSGVETFLSEVI